MTVRLSLASRAVDTPMGQQSYEEALAVRAGAALGPGWEVHRVVVRTMRSPLPGSRRVPARLLSGELPLLRRAVGQLIYRGADVVHRLDLRLPPAPSPEVLTVHDVAPWRFPDEGRPPVDAGMSARRAAAVVCPSAFAASDVAERLGTTTPTVIPNGVDERFFDAAPLPAERLARLGVRPPFLLHAGGCTLRKNLAALAEAWRLVTASHREVGLVLAGPPDPRRDGLFGPLVGAVRVGRVDDQTLAGLMASAAAVVVPSRYEGFGLPALEGMAAGVPVVAARRGALPEVCADAAYLVEPDAAGLAEGMVAALEGGADVRSMAARGRARAARFTWTANAEAHAALWRGVAS